MFPVALADPLWWVAARLRRILTGLLVLALALGAHGHAAVAAPPSGAPLGNPPLAVQAAQTPSKFLVSAVASRADRPTPRAVGSTASPIGAAIPAAVPALPPVGAPAVTPPDPLARQVCGSDERVRVGDQAAPPGQRAPPAS